MPLSLSGKLGREESEDPSSPSTHLPSLFLAFLRSPPFYCGGVGGMGEIVRWPPPRECSFFAAEANNPSITAPPPPPAVFKGGDGSGGGKKAPAAAAAASIIQDTRTTSKGAREEESSRVKSIGLPKSG